MCLTLQHLLPKQNIVQRLVLLSDCTTPRFRIPAEVHLRTCAETGACKLDHLGVSTPPPPHHVESVRGHMPAMDFSNLSYISRPEVQATSMILGEHMYAFAESMHRC